MLSTTALSSLRWQMAKRSFLAVGLLVLSIACLKEQTASAQQIIAHRGASHDAPENTLAAFRLAWELDADGAEGDFQLTVDGQIVCMHDYDTERTGGKKLIVKDSTLTELQSLDVGLWKNSNFQGEQIPTLSQVLALVPEGKLFFLEIKCGPEIVGPMRKVIDQSGLASEQIVLICFDTAVIAECKKQLPNHKTQWLTSFKKTGSKWNPSTAAMLKTLREIGADGVGCKAVRQCFNQEVIAQLTAAGFSHLGVWTIDSVHSARYYQKAGVWTITTNRPGWMRKQLLEAAPVKQIAVKAG